MDYFDNDGLINSRKDEINAENKALWTLEYVLLGRLFGLPVREVEMSLLEFYRKCERGRGLFDQRTFRDGTPEDYMSHDQLTALMCFSYMRSMVWHREIWVEIKRQGYRYDNLNPDKPRRWLHPRDIIFYGLLNDVWWCKKLFPLFAFFCEQTCKKKWKVRNKVRMRSTDGKLLTFVRCLSAMHRLPKMGVLFEKCTDLIRKNDIMRGWKTVFGIYFCYSDHPIRKIIEQGCLNGVNKNRFF